MGEKKKKEKKQMQMVILKEKSVETPKKIKDLIEGLEELEREQKHVDIQICPRCMSHRIHRVGSMIGDMSGHIGLLPPKFECLDCGWRERMVIKATSRKMGTKEVAIIAEALDKKTSVNECTNAIE